MTGPRKIRLSVDDLDLPDEMQGPLGAMFANLNPFLADTSRALQGQLTVGTNLVSTYKDATVTVPALVWTAVSAFSNSWVNYGGSSPNAEYLIDDRGWVHVRGVVKNGTAIPTTIFTLPAGYQPTHYVHFATPSNGGFGEIDVTTAGAISAQAGSTNWIALTGLCFPAAAAAAPPVYTGAGWPITLAPTYGAQYQTRDVRVVQAVDTATGDRVGNGCNGLPQWRRATNGNVLVDRVAGLTPGRTYHLSFLLLGEPAAKL